MDKCKLKTTCLAKSVGYSNSNLLLKIWDDFHPDDCWRQIRVRAASLLSGSHKYEWDASHMGSGVYLYKLEAGDLIEIKKMILMK